MLILPVTGWGTSNRITCAIAWLRQPSGIVSRKIPFGTDIVSVQDESVVDIISIREPDSIVVLTISDHLDWSDSVQHQTILQAKLNRYLAFVESGELLERYPAGKDRAVRIAIVFKFKPDREALEFLRKAKKVIESAGFSLETGVFAESYDN